VQQPAYRAWPGGWASKARLDSINAGSYQLKVLPDKWTTVTKDRSLSAQFEHTLAVTETGFEIFTLSALTGSLVGQ
jgi:methionyl aminopeptidase